MATETDEIRTYVRRAIEAGQPRDAIRATLEGAGWSTPQIARALDAWSDGPAALAVPRPRAQISAREAFVYLTLLAALYLTTWYLGSLIFDLIEIWVPDPAESDWRDRTRGRSIRWAIAALIVALPLFLALTVRMNREMTGDPMRRQSAVRQWLGHMTLFIAALVVIGALMTTLYNLLAGELTIRIALKVLTVTGLAAAVFFYYRADLRTEPDR